MEQIIFIVIFSIVWAIIGYKIGSEKAKEEYSNKNSYTFFQDGVIQVKVIRTSDKWVVKKYKISEIK